jgi:ATP-dependent Lon protease
VRYFRLNKEQQKRIGAAEFRNTHFSFTRYPDGIEQFVSTPELHNENSVGSDPLPAGQVWALSPGGTDENPGLFRIEVSEGPGRGLKILNQSPPGPLKESVRCAEQNLYARAKELVGDRDPRAHEFAIQFRAFDANKNAATGIPILLAMSSALVERSLEGGLVVVGGLNLGGSVEPIYNAVSIIELAADKGAQKVLMPVSARKQLFDLPDDLATKVAVVYYADAKDALLKALSE